jgi:hypothetical protein
MLIDTVTGTLGHIRVPVTGDLLPHLSIWTPGQFPVNGATATLDERGSLAVRALIRDNRAWGLLQEHLLQDPLWKSVTDWEIAMAGDLQARRCLYVLAQRFLTDKTGWSVNLGPDKAREPLKHRDGIERFYEEVFARALGIPRPDWEADMFYEENGWVRHRGTGRVWAPGQTDKVFQIMMEGLEALPGSQEAVRAAETYRHTEETTEAVHASLEDMRLLRYLPRVCSVCGRVEGI